MYKCHVCGKQFRGGNRLNHYGLKIHVIGNFACTTFGNVECTRIGNIKSRKKR